MECFLSVGFLILGFGHLIEGDSSTPSLLWPLSETTALSEVMQGVDLHRTSFEDDSYCYPFTDGNPKLPYLSLFLDGSVYDVTFSGQFPSMDFTFSVLLYPEETFSGTLFHYRYDTGDIMSIWAMDGTVLFNFWDEYGVSVGSVASPDLLPAKKWSHLVFMRDFETGTLTVFVNGEEIIKEDDDFPNSIYLPTSGKLRIGGSLDKDTSSNPSLRITCLQVYNSTMHADNVNQLIDNCLPNRWKISPQITVKPQDSGKLRTYCVTSGKPSYSIPEHKHSNDTVDLTCLTQGKAWDKFTNTHNFVPSVRNTASFYLVSRDALPTQDEIVLGEVNAPDKKVCARLCMKVDGCRAYGVFPEGSGMKCTMYRAVARQLDPAAGAKYYAIRT